MRESVLEQRVLRDEADRRHDVAAVHGAQEDAGGRHTVRQHVRHDLARAMPRATSSAPSASAVARSPRYETRRPFRCEQERCLGLRGRVPVDDLAQGLHAEMR
jgi:hypothetical protein